MGGKKNVAQRTKGNVKPASSSHAAQLLEASGGIQSGFVGFDALSGDLGYVPATLQSSETAECRDGELRMVMKRLTKRDAVTKLKALQNFSEICQERDSEVVTDALNYWPRLYSKLAIDYDHRVREAAHRALKQVAEISGRNLAPHLKHLIGAWMTSLCDNYGPAASAAKSAFIAAFPTDVKQAQAVVYCHNELIKFISEMLFTATPQTLSDAKVTPLLEMKEKYERILSASLLCLRLIIKMCPEENISDLSEKCATILEQSAFWKYANHENRMVQSSFFGLIAYFIRNMPRIANERSAKFCSVVLSRLGETDPVICPSLWEAVECATTNIEKFWLHVSLRKAMLPGLWSSLKKGFDGNAAVAAPRLAAIITNLPADVTGSAREFYSLFFSHLRTGLALEKVHWSSKEMNSLVLAYTHCLRLVVDWCIENDDISLLEDILENQLFNTLEEALLQPEKAFAKSCLFDQFTKFIVSLGSQLNKLNSTTREAEICSCARDLCWERLKSLCSQCTASDQSYKMTRLVSLLKCLILLEDNDESKPAASRMVGFNDKTGKKKAVGSIRSPGANPYNLLTPGLRLRTDHIEVEKTVELIASVCSQCLCAEGQQHHMLSAAMSLCELCGSDVFYKVLAELQGGANSSDVIDTCLAMLSKREDDWTDISKLVIIITEHVDEELAFSTLVKLTQVFVWRNMDMLMKLVLSADWLSRTLRRWLTHESFQTHVLSLRGVFEGFTVSTEHIPTLTDAVAFFKMIIKASNFDDGDMGSLCDVIQNQVIARLPTVESTELFNILCDCIEMMLSRKISVDNKVLVTSLVQWICNTSQPHQAECGERAIELLKKVIHECYSDLSCVVLPIRAVLEAAGNNIDNFTLVCNMCCQLSSCLPENFIELFIQDIADNTDDVQLLKWLSVSAMSGQLVLEDVSCYIGYKLSDVHWSCPHFITHILFASHYLRHIQQVPSSLSSTLHRHMAVAHTWMTAVLHSKGLIPVNTETLLSSERISDLTYWLLDEEKNSKTCIELMNTCDSVVTTLALFAADKHLPKEFDAVLGAQATLYISAFETLCEAKFQCLNAIAHLLSGNEASELLDLVAARLISANIDEMDWGWRGVTGLLHLAAVLMQRQGVDDSDDNVVFGILELIFGMQAEQPHQFICEKYPYLPKVDSNSRLDLNVSLVSFSTQVLRLCSQKLASKQWDQLLCRLDSWIGDEHCMLPKDINNFHNQLYISNVLNSVVMAGQVMKSVATSPALYPKDLLSEWVELHALSIFNLLLPYFVSRVETLSRDTVTVQQLYITFCLCNAHLYCPSNSVHKNTLPVKLVPGAKHHLPVEHESALNHLVPLLLSPSSMVQCSSFTLLNHLISVLPPFDKEPLEDNTEGRCPPVTLISMLDHCGSQLLSLVGGARIGVDKPLDLLPHSEELLCVRGYLLTWRLLIKYLEYSSSQQMVEYSYHLKQNHYTEDLLLLLFNILPLEKPLPNGDLFSFNLLLNLEDSFDMNEVISVASVVYYHLVKILPALVRCWYLDLEKRANALLDRFTAKYVSPRLCKEEMELISVRSMLYKADNLNVRVRHSAREIVATYTLEEFSIELMIILPSNYPVGVTSVECSKKLGVATSEWRKWMLQLNTFLTYQNGSVANAINLWKDNLDKKFAGIEECYICYSVLHGTNLQLPKQQCKTCKKKFHSACLYKWFTSSQKSTCPLCRNLF